MTKTPDTTLSKRLQRGEPLRVAFLTVMPSPYTVDMFSAMAADGRIAPHVFYQEMAPPDTHWGTVELPPYARVLPGGSVPFLGGRLLVNRGAIGHLRRAAADLHVIAGYSGITNQTVMQWLHLSGRPWIFWGETPGMRQGKTLGLLRWLAQRPAVRWPHGIAAIGSRAVTAYRSLARENCIVENVPYHCELQPFLELPSRTADGTLRFLYCGQLIERKGVEHLVSAFCRVAQRHPDISLTLVGEGPLRGALENSVPASLKPRVSFTGFRQLDTLPACFGDADVFVLPSRHDGWGVVVNQAIAAGLPVICSNAVGAGEDLVLPDQNGLVFPANDEQALESALEQLAANPEQCRTMGQVSRELSLQWTPQQGVERWWRLCLRTLKAVRRLPSDYPVRNTRLAEPALENWQATSP